MSLGRALQLCALACVLFLLILLLIRAVSFENGVGSGLAFVLLGPLLDRVALRIGGDAGPRVFWSAACWVAPVLAFALDARLEAGEPGHELFGVVTTADAFGVSGAAFVAACAATGARQLGLRSTLLRRVMPWIAIGATAFVGGRVAMRTFGDHPVRGDLRADWHAPAAAPGAALIGVVIAGVALRRRARGLAKLRGLDGDWRSGTMTADGLVTVEGLAPMHAPTGIVHFAGPVMVRVEDAAATGSAPFRTTGAAKITALLQGVDADLAGRRAILDEGARAYATAAALLPAAASYAAFLLQQP